MSCHNHSLLPHPDLPLCLHPGPFGKPPSSSLDALLIWFLAGNLRTWFLLYTQVRLVFACPAHLRVGH